MRRFSKNSLSWLSRRESYRLALALPALAVAAGFTAFPEKKEDLDLRVEKVADFHLAQFMDSNEFQDPSNRQFIPFTEEDQTDNSSKDDPSDPRVLITEVIIEGLDDHPDKERLEFAAYDAMSVRPGNTVNRKDLKLDLDAIYSTGWFTGARVEPINSPLGVQLLVQVDPNPILKRIEISPKNSKLPAQVINDVFSADFGKTLNLNVLRIRMKELKGWYSNEGYSLARISGPNRVTPEGIVQLTVVEGTVAGVEINFLNKDGEAVNEDGKPIKGKTRPWVIRREISLKTNDVFNRNQLEQDIKRLYGTSLLSDVKVTLRPVIGETGKVIIVLGITEQSTGSLSGGIGYSGGQGAFGQIGLEETNFFGRAWKTSLNFTYGQYGGLVNFSFADPWIRGDKYRTSFRTSLFISREVPQEFRSQSGGSIRSVADYYDAPNNNGNAYDIGSTAHGFNTTPKYASVAAAKDGDSTKSWFDYDGDSVALQRKGGTFSFARPLNGGNPYKKATWNVLVGMNFQQVEPIDYAGNSRPYGVSINNLKDGSAPNNDVICVSFNCATENTLIGIRTAATFNTLNDPRNPTTGDFLSLGSEQYVSVGEDSPTFNRAKASYSHFFPVNWLKIAKGCRPKRGEQRNCPQAIGVQVKAGTIVGELPPYEAFCLGGSSSVRGWNSCDLGVGRSFGEATVEYRFPIWKLLSGAVFVDGATDFDSQANVPGKPGELLGKNGSGFSPGAGLIVNTPVGPLRLEGAKRDFDGDWRFNLGVGWKF